MVELHVPNKLQQFLMTDKRFKLQDVEFWASTMDAFLQFYKETAIDSEDDKASKAIAAARLAGLGEAMSQHFSACIDTCIDTTVEGPDLQACVAASERVYNMCERHTMLMEDRAIKALV